jgi:hypothetical protein
MLERIAAVGWQKAWWSSGDGMDICSRYSRTADGLWVQCPGTYVFLSGYQDLDFHQAFLLTVCTQTDDGTTVDYLSVYQKHAGTENLDVEWAQLAHPFFEGPGLRVKALHWWVDLVDGR